MYTTVVFIGWWRAVKVKRMKTKNTPCFGVMERQSEVSEKKGFIELRKSASKTQYVSA